MSSCKPIFEELVAQFDNKVAKDANLQKELECLTKKVNIDLGTEKYSFILDNKKVTNFSECLLPCADIVVISDPQTIKDLYSGKMKMMKAWALKKICVKGSLEDVLRLRKFF
ncbi:MAG: SCP2 sterol-binding domain-containing protein [Methanomassiliicoccales archaeon]|nr:MAG: SCP2 sterol-binding domain-containing protein [Methanomassiliicoccales archaeon]